MQASAACPPPPHMLSRCFLVRAAVDNEAERARGHQRELEKTIADNKNMPPAAERYLESKIPKAVQNGIVGSIRTREGVSIAIVRGSRSP